MITRHAYKIHRLILVTLAAGMTGCASTLPEEHLYLISDPQREVVKDVVAREEAATTQCRPVKVRVDLPVYLQRQGLMLQLPNGEMVSATRHQWAEPLVYGIERLLDRCLRATPVKKDATDLAELGVQVTIEHLHGTSDGTSLLQARWRTNDQSIERAGDYSSLEPQRQTGYAAMVDTQRGLVLGLCAQIEEKLPSCAE